MIAKFVGQRTQNMILPCPACHEYIAFLKFTTKADLKCPWCNERLRLVVDMENYCSKDGTKLVTYGSHWDES